MLSIPRSWMQRHGDWLVGWYTEGFIAFCVDRSSWMELENIVISLETLEFFGFFFKFYSLALIIWVASLIRGYDNLNWSVYCESGLHISNKSVVMLKKPPANWKTPKNKPQLFETKGSVTRFVTQGLCTNSTMFDMKILHGGDCIVFLMRKFVILYYSHWKPT